MLEGTYALNLNTPMGSIPCKIGLWMERGSLSRQLRNDGIEKLLQRWKSRRQ